MVKITKIALVDLAHTATVADTSLSMPLGIGYVKAYANAVHGDSIDIKLFKHPERFLSWLAKERPAVVGFANYGWNENLNRVVGAHVRKILPDALIVAGGPNIDDSEVRRRRFLDKHSYVDYLIIDGGEEPFAELIGWYRDGSGDPALLPSNIAWAEGVGMRFSGERPLKKIIENIPSPYLSGILDEFLEAGLIPLFETNRGCPFKCTFCAWGSASKDLVRRLDLETALAEIEYVGKKSRAPNWIVCDANFGILPRDIEIAKAIRRIKDIYGTPHKCHVWLAKNVTSRNLEIGSILGDMVVPVMAVQSLDNAVLENIKRDNISTKTYVEYQKKFHKMGSRTYSDLIVPLPGETFASHIHALRTLLDYGVDIVQSHNMRLLAGAETNSDATRQTYAFRTRYRLIHGDAGVYKCPDGSVLKAFEYEESLRETSSMTEADLFKLRKLHFLVDFCWNIEVYKPLLKVGQIYGLNPVEILQRLLISPSKAVSRFFAEFDKLSCEEWFDSADEIESYFAVDANFERLIGQEFEKLNIMFSVILLKEYKPAFDAAILEVIKSYDRIPPRVVDDAANLAFTIFPPLRADSVPASVTLAENYTDLTEQTAHDFVPSPGRRVVELQDSPRRRALCQIILASQGQTLSKVLNTQGISLGDLRLALPDSFRREMARSPSM